MTTSMTGLSNHQSNGWEGEGQFLQEGRSYSISSMRGLNKARTIAGATTTTIKARAIRNGCNVFSLDVWCGDATRESSAGLEKA
jgi:hypothetical protein